MKQCALVFDEMPQVLAIPASGSGVVFLSEGETAIGGVENALDTVLSNTITSATLQVRDAIRINDPRRLQ